MLRTHRFPLSQRSVCKQAPTPLPGIRTHAYSSLHARATPTHRRNRKARRWHLARVPPGLQSHHWARIGLCTRSTLSLPIDLITVCWLWLCVLALLFCQPGAGRGSAHMGLSGQGPTGEPLTTLDQQIRSGLETRIGGAGGSDPWLWPQDQSQGGGRWLWPLGHWF